MSKATSAVALLVGGFVVYLFTRNRFNVYVAKAF